MTNFNIRVYLTQAKIWQQVTIIPSMDGMTWKVLHMNIGICRLMIFYEPIISQMPMLQLKNAPSNTLVTLRKTLKMLALTGIRL